MNATPDATPEVAPDVLAVHARTQPDAVAVVVDGSGGGTASDDVVR